MDVPPAYDEGQGEAPDSGQLTPVASGELLEPWPPATLLTDLPLKTLDFVEESWALPSFPTLTGKVISPVFSCGGASWYVLLLSLREGLPTRVLGASSSFRRGIRAKDPYPSSWRMSSLQKPLQRMTSGLSARSLPLPW